MKTKYDRHGALYINKNSKLVDNNNKEITLTCLPVIHSQAQDSSLFRGKLEQIQEEQNIDAICLTISFLGDTGYCYMDSLSRKEVRVNLDNAIKAATELGLYVIIRLQSFPTAYDASTSASDIVTLPSPDMEVLSDFFHRTAKRYQSYGNILYELVFPENNGSDTGFIMEIIRQYDTFAIIMHHHTCEIPLPLKEYNLAYAPALYEKAISLLKGAVAKVDELS